MHAAAASATRLATFLSDLGTLFRFQSLKQLSRHVLKDDLPGIAAEVSFYVLFALFPFLVFVGAALALLVPDPEVALGRLLVLLHRFVPATTAALLAQFLEGPLQANRPYLLSFGILGILWAGSQGFAAMLKALARVYCTRETRSWIRQRAISMAMMALAAIASVAALLVMTGLDPSGILSPWVLVPEFVMTLWGWLRWTLLFVILWAVLTWLYTTVPCVSAKRRWVMPGSIVAALAWVAVNAGFASYMDRRGSYASLYGAVGDVIVLMLWIYVGVFIVLLGAEINAKIVQPARG
ncbi:MAG TPA: YihY/virulence factor BrkB family protein [Candidatus Limnocylindria bacterium]|nr:YihY/virulence factor BrkB family protein [Candidatus Limnocylindria bacterium]